MKLLAKHIIGDDGTPEAMTVYLDGKLMRTFTREFHGLEFEYRVEGYIDAMVDVYQGLEWAYE